MRLFVKCKQCGNKIYLSSNAKNRIELPMLIILKCPSITCNRENTYWRNDVIAEPDLNAASGAILGAAFGLLLGPDGAVVGGLLGAAVGSRREKEDLEAVNRFNNEW